MQQQAQIMIQYAIQLWQEVLNNNHKVGQLYLVNGSHYTKLLHKLSLDMTNSLGISHNLDEINIIKQDPAGRVIMLRQLLGLLKAAQGSPIVPSNFNFNDIGKAVLK